MINYSEILIEKINKSHWWHVPPQDPGAYKKRGKFLASTYSQAEFYGRPQDVAERVQISNPLWSDSELEILKILFPDSYQEKHDAVISADDHDYYEQRITLDRQMYERAKELGYDAIVLLGSTGIRELAKNRKPRSIELNLCLQT